MPIGSARKMFVILIVLEVYKHNLFPWQRWRIGFLVFPITFFSWKTALLKICYSPSNYSLLILAREEYVTPSNATSASSLEASQG